MLPLARRRARRQNQQPTEDSRNYYARSRSAWNEEGIDAGIQSRELSAMMDSQCEKIEVGQSTRSHTLKRRNDRSIEQGDLIGEEAMPGDGGDQFAQGHSRSFRSARPTRIGGLAKNANEAVFREGTGSPTFVGMLLHPTRSAIMVFMIGILPRNEHINIEQPDRH
jgi:hypothetical protein